MAGQATGIARKLTMAKIKRAAGRLTGVAHHTPLDYSVTFSEMTGNSVYLKLENLQKTGSFKIRGAYNKVMSLNEGSRTRGVIAASAGNHAQGVAYAALKAGIQCTIIMPDSAPLAKVMATRGYGADVVLTPGGYEEAYRFAVHMQKEKGATFVHAFDDIDVIAGQGTVALEIIEDLPEVEAVFVPVGGGGLISGVSFALKSMLPQVRVFGVQATGAPGMHISHMHDKLMESRFASTFADGIAVRRPGKVTFDLTEQYVDDIITVDDEEIAGAIILLLERSKIVAEGAGAVGLAALLGKKVHMSGCKTAVILSGGNIDINTLSLIIERGLIKTGRRIRLRVLAPDRPGSLCKLLAVVADTGANVVSVLHNRIKLSVPIKQVEVELALETRDLEHIGQIISKLSQDGYHPEVYT